MGVLAVIAFIAMIGMYVYWFLYPFLKKRIEKKKQEKLSEKSVPAESANEKKKHKKIK